MKRLKSIIKYIIVFVILIIVYFVSLLLTSLIPSSAIKENVTKSSETLVMLGEKKAYELGYTKEEAFTFTDALMVNTAFSIDSSHPLESMLLARRSYIPGQTMTVYEESKDVLSSSMYMDSSGSYQTKELYGLMHNDGNTEGFEYPRYWHGYLAILRPLLLLFDYNTIRWLSCICLVVLSIALAVILAKKINKITGFIFLASLLIVNIFIAGLCLNEATTYYIAIIASIVLALWYKKIKNNIGLLFFIVGSVTSFLDLFTTPLITIGIPLVIYFLFRQKEDDVKISKQLIELIQLSVFWGLGYGLTWFAKWAITDLILHKGIILEAIEQILFRTVSRTDRLLTDKELQKIYIDSYFDNYILISIVCLTVLYITISFIKDRNKKVKINVGNILPYIIIALYPTIWFFVVKQHTLKHIFFTKRLIVIPIMAFQIIIATLLGYYAKEKKLREIKNE